MHCVDKINFKKLEIEITKLRNELACDRCNKKKEYVCCNNKPYDSVLNELKSSEECAGELEKVNYKLKIANYHALINQ